jgi:hypothetical protein
LPPVTRATFPESDGMSVSGLKEGLLNNITADPIARAPAVRAIGDVARFLKRGECASLEAKDMAGEVLPI